MRATLQKIRGTIDVDDTKIIINLINLIEKTDASFIPDDSEIVNLIDKLIASNNEATEVIKSGIAMAYIECLGRLRQLKGIEIDTEKFNIEIIKDAKYIELIQFLSEECKNVLPFLCSDAIKIIGNKKYKDGYLNDYSELINAIKDTIIVDSNSSPVIIKQFNREMASSQWNITKVKKAELANLKKLQNENPGLLGKTLTGDPLKSICDER